MSFTGLINKQTMLYAYKETLFGVKKKLTINTQKDIPEP